MINSFVWTSGDSVDELKSQSQELHNRWIEFGGKATRLTLKNNPCPCSLCKM